MESKLISFVLFLTIKCSSVLSCILRNVGHVNGAGSSCEVSSLMPGKQSTQIIKGTCYPSLLCRHRGGEAIGRCGLTDVCCIFPRTCSDITAYNSTYFTNPGYPFYYNNSNSCLLTIHRTPGINRICQLRLDFMEFELVPPSKGNCNTDIFTVNGQNLNSIVPQLCGYNSGQHIYLDIDGGEAPIKLNIQTYGSVPRRWNILISQIECNHPFKAPPNCLQYFMSPNGEIMSFNYEIPPKTGRHKTKLNEKIKSFGYMNEMDYTICFRKEQFFCTQTYSVNISNSVNQINDQSISIFGEWSSYGMAGAGIIECPTDYLLLNGIRFCGERLNENAVKNTNIINNKEITDNGTGPFIVRFVSDKEWNEESRGFKLEFKQKPCSVYSHNSQESTHTHKLMTQSNSGCNVS